MGLLGNKPSHKTLLPPCCRGGRAPQGSQAVFSRFPALLPLKSSLPTRALVTSEGGRGAHTSSQGLLVPGRQMGRRAPGARAELDTGVYVEDARWLRLRRLSTTPQVTGWPCAFWCVCGGSPLKCEAWTRAFLDHLSVKAGLR